MDRPAEPDDRLDAAREADADNDADTDIGTDTDTGLLSIGRFAGRVGVAPSALRFYDDGALLVPARVDPATGYRWYRASQEARAVLIRTLREAGLPLAAVRAVIDATPEDARRLLVGHREELAASSKRAAAALAGAIELVGDAATTISVAGTELARAIRQVTPAVGAADEQFALGAVRVEIDHDELRLAATDRYRLTLRSLPAVHAAGEPAVVLLGAAALDALASRARAEDLVTLTLEAGAVRAAFGDTAIDIPIVPGDFPDPQVLLDAMAPRTTRVVANRTAVLELLSRPEGGAAIELIGDAGSASERASSIRVVVSPAGGDPPIEHSLAAEWRGSPFRIAFARDVLLAAVEAGVGPDVMLELAMSPYPTVVRSADQGTLTTLVMPTPLAATSS